MELETDEPRRPAPIDALKVQGVIIIALLLFIAGILAYKFLHKPDHPQRFEYKIESITDKDFIDGVNKLGNDGWDLVFARRATSGEGYLSTASYEMIFKRPAIE